MEPDEQLVGRRWANAGTRWRWLRRAPLAVGIRRALLAVGLILTPLIGFQALSQDVIFFRIGTGATSGTYFPIGGIIASAISNPPGSRECERGGSCGVPGLIAVAQSTSGSVNNVERIVDGSLESGFSQSDIAFWAFEGNGIFKDRGPIEDIRAIANLFPESIHIVVRQDAFLSGVADLRGKRISIDREGSGTRVDALLILKAYGLGLEDVQAQSIAVGAAADLLRAGELDAFFFVAGTPANAVTQLAQDNLVTLLPISGPEAEALRKHYPFFAEDSIPAGTYMNVPQTNTLSVGAQWLVAADQPEELVYQITRALWNESTRQLLDNGHPKGKRIRIETALEGVGIPLHPGAKRFYEEAGLEFDDENAAP